MEASILELATLAVVSAAADFINHYNWGSPLFLIYGNFLLLPTMIFINPLRFRMERLWVYVSLATVIGGFATCAALQFLFSERLDSPDDGVRVWLHITYAAAVLYCLPAYFNFIKPPRPHPAPRDVVLPLVVVLPFNVIVGISVLPGTFLDTVVKSKECRAAVKASCWHAALVCCTVAAAAAADWLGLVAAETTRIYLSIMGAVTLICLTPICMSPRLNTRRAIGYSNMALAASIVATGVLHATGIVALDTIDGAATSTIRTVVFFGFLLVPHIRAAIMIAERF